MVWISVQSYSKFYLFKWWKLCATRIRISFIHENVLIRIHFSSFNFQQIKTAMKKKLSNSVIQKLYTGNYHILWLSFTGEECMKIHAHSPQEKCIVWNLFFSLSRKCNHSVARTGCKSLNASITQHSSFADVSV